MSDQTSQPEKTINFGLALQLWNAHILEITENSVQIAWEKTKGFQINVDAKYFVSFTADPSQCDIKESGLKYVKEEIENYNDCIDTILSKTHFGNNRAILAVSPEVFYGKRPRKR